MDIGVLLLIAAASVLSYAIGRAHEADTQLAQLIAVHLAPQGSETPRTVAPTLVYSSALGVRVEAQSRRTTSELFLVAETNTWRARPSGAQDERRGDHERDAPVRSTSITTRCHQPLRGGGAYETARAFRWTVK